MSLILSGTDGLSDIDGSAATPAIRGTDANTGIFFPAADTIAFSEGGAEVMRIDSAGNVGIGTNTPITRLHASGTDTNPVALRLQNTTASTGKTWQITSTNAGSLQLATIAGVADYLTVDSSGRVGISTTPSAWNTAVKALDVGTLTSLYDGSGFGLTSNAYYSAGANWTYKTTAVASVLTSTVGALYYYNAPSGTAGTTISLTERFQVSAAGLVGIGKTPAYPLDVNGTVNGTIFASWNNTFTATSGGAAASFGNIGLYYVYWQNAAFSIFGSDVVLCNVYAGATVIASNAYTGGGAAPTRTYSSSPYLAVSFTGGGSSSWLGHYTLIQ